MKNLSERVRLIISENNLKQKEFADKLNVTQSHVSKLLHGTSGMSASTAKLIEELFGYSAKWILSGDEPKLSCKYIDKISDEEAIIAEKFSALPEDLKVLIESQLDQLLKYSDKIN